MARTVNGGAGDLIFGAPLPVNSLFPLFQLHAIVDYGLPFGGLRAGAELSWVAGRSASRSNALLRGDAYELPPYVYTALSLSTAGRKIFG